MVTKQYKPLWQ